MQCNNVLNETKDEHFFSGPNFKIKPNLNYKQLTVFFFRNEVQNISWTLWVSTWRKCGKLFSDEARKLLTLVDSSFANQDAEHNALRKNKQKKQTILPI